MNLKEIFDSLTVDDINEYVNSETEEDLHLEFKQAVHPGKDPGDSDRKYFSKCLSGFANSDGGFIIWGVGTGTKNGIDAAAKLKPIPGLSKFSTRLKRLEGITVTPKITGVEYRKIFDRNQEDKGFLVVYVPSSEYAPHMANHAKKWYYKRSGDSFYNCEHYDIMDIINRKRHPQINVCIGDFEIKHSGTLGGHDGKRFYVMSVILKIINTGLVSARFPRLEVNISKPYIIGIGGLDGNGYKGLQTAASVNYGYGYYGGQEIIVHGKSELAIDKIVLHRFTDVTEIEDFNLTFQVIADGIESKNGEIKIEKEQLRRQFNEFIQQAG